MNEMIDLNENGCNFRIINLMEGQLYSRNKLK